MSGGFAMRLTQLIRLVAVAFALPAGLAPAAARAQPLQTVRVGADVDAGTLDPRLARDTGAYRATDLIYDGLVHLSANLTPEPDLAVSWQNPDPTHWIFKLRPGVTFQDGSPFTADDVVYTYQAVLDPKFNAPMRALYTPISKIEAKDPLTVEFTLSTPYAPLLSYLDLGIVPKAKGLADLATHPVGAGPMQLSQWDRGNRMVLTANPHYWGGQPKVKELDLVVVGDNTARAQAFEAGDLDLIQSPLSPQDIKRLTGEGKFDHAIMAGLGVTYINFNCADPTLADPRMRRALAMLIDQKTIVDQIYEGVDKLASSVLMPSSWDYTPKITQPAYDPKAAEAALADLGWTRGPDGMLQKQGTKLQLTLSTHSEDPNRVQTIEFLQAQFQQAGIQAQVKISDWPSFSAGYVMKGLHQVALLGWLNIVDPDRLLYGQLHTGGPLNWGHYSNPQVDALLDLGRSALTQDARKQAYQRVAAILAQDLPYYILSDQGYQLFTSKALGTVRPNPRGYLRNVVLANGD
jgi:peptide/nickel transport system substrate-binding protein